MVHEIEADFKDSQALKVEDLRDVFRKLRASMKQISLYRHNVERYAEYLAPCHEALEKFLASYGTVEVRVDAMSYRFQGHLIYEDPSKDNNLIYPFWANGVRLLIFTAGITAKELLEFIMLAFEVQSRVNRNEDFVTRLWKCEFAHIDYVVVESFKVSPDDDPQEVEIAVDKIVAYLYRNLQSKSKDYMRFARVSVADLNLELDDVDQIRGAVLDGDSSNAEDKARVASVLSGDVAKDMPKLITILFQLLELDTTRANYGDVTEAFVQLLDALLIGGQFAEISELRKRFNRSLNKKHLKAETKDLVRELQATFMLRMADAQRIQMIAQILNQGIVKDVAPVTDYLMSLGEGAVAPLIQVLETLQLLPNRRLVANVLADLGKRKLKLFTARLDHPSSNLVKDMLYIINKIAPKDKFKIFERVLQHPNTILRLETLAIIGSNPTSRCFSIVEKIFKNHDDSQMRAQAARCFANYDPQMYEDMLLHAVQWENLEEKNISEAKALFTALGKAQTENTRAFLIEILNTKSNILNRKRVEHLKILAITALEASPSVNTLTRLAKVAKDRKRHSADVCDLAFSAAAKMNAKLVGSST